MVSEMDGAGVGLAFGRGRGHWQESRIGLRRPLFFGPFPARTGPRPRFLCGGRGARFTISAEADASSAP